MPVAPPPSWAPAELLHDPHARLTLHPNAVNFVTEGQALQLKIAHGEVSIRAQGELAMSLKASESELRVSLAQAGLTLKETTDTQHTDDGTPDRRRQQHPEERSDEWT